MKATARPGRIDPTDYNRRRIRERVCRARKRGVSKPAEPKRGLRFKYLEHGPLDAETAAKVSAAFEERKPFITAARYQAALAQAFGEQSRSPRTGELIKRGPNAVRATAVAFIYTTLGTIQTRRNKRLVAEYVSGADIEALMNRCLRLTPIRQAGAIPAPAL